MKLIRDGYRYEIDPALVFIGPKEGRKYLLGMKLIEEAKEVSEALHVGTEASEIGDLLEVLDALFAEYPGLKDKALAAQRKKMMRFGKFDLNLVLKDSK